MQLLNLTGLILTLLVASIVSATDVAAQSESIREDSLRFEEGINSIRVASFEMNARRYGMKRIEAGDAQRVIRLLEFMAHRKGTAPWISAEEELLLRLASVDTETLLDVERLQAVLQKRQRQPGPLPTARDDLSEWLQDRIQRSGASFIHTLTDSVSDSVEAAFLVLLRNTLTVQGLRTVDEVNRHVDQFVNRNPASPLAAIADRYLRQEIGRSSFESALHVGYGVGNFVSSSEHNYLGPWHGPVISGLMSYSSIQVELWATAGSVVYERELSIDGKMWGAGNGSLVGVGARLGYSLNAGWARVTPSIGLTATSLSSAGRPGVPTYKTGLRPGAVGAVSFNWRIPFDRSPHIDLHVTLFGGSTGFSSLLTDLDTTMFGLILGFGLADQNYSVKPVGGSRN